MDTIATRKLYHIIHYDRLAAIIKSKALLSDTRVHQLGTEGTTIGFCKIKRWRQESLIPCYEALHVGDCVPFYFCPRSVMLFIISKQNHPELAYRGGQEPILHIVFDLVAIIDWASKQGKRWAFTDSNAGSKFFNAYSSIADFKHLDWGAIDSKYWPDNRDAKQSEFLLEERCPISLIQEIGVYSTYWRDHVNEILETEQLNIPVAIHRDWYY